MVKFIKGVGQNVATVARKALCHIVKCVEKQLKSASANGTNKESHHFKSMINKKKADGLMDPL